MKSYGSSSSWQRGRQREASFACESPARRPVSTAGVRSLRKTDGGPPTEPPSPTRTAQAPAALSAVKTRMEVRR